MDSTLINHEVIDELARTIGVSDLVSAITERAMAGELDFAASLKERVALLKGVKTDVWEDLKGVITFSSGARELCRALKKLGVKMAVLSGGFQPMADWAKEELGLDYAYANHVRRCSLGVYKTIIYSTTEPGFEYQHGISFSSPFTFLFWSIFYLLYLRLSLMSISLPS